MILKYGESEGLNVMSVYIIKNKIEPKPNCALK